MVNFFFFLNYVKLIFFGILNGLEKILDTPRLKKFADVVNTSFCRRSMTVWFWDCWKHHGERRKCWLPAFSSFFHDVLRGFRLRYLCILSNERCPFHYFMLGWGAVQQVFQWRNLWDIDRKPAGKCMFARSITSALLPEIASPLSTTQRSWNCLFWMWEFFVLFCFVLE